jgi:hypothetical protein
MYRCELRNSLRESFNSRLIKTSEDKFNRQPVIGQPPRCQSMWDEIEALNALDEPNQYHWIRVS